MLVWASMFKGSMAFRQLIDNYLAWMEKDMLPREPVMLEEYPILSAAETEKRFASELSYLPLYKRLQHLKKKLEHRIKQKKKEIVETVTEKYREKIDRLKARGVNPEIVNTRVVALLEEKDAKIALIEKSARTLAKNYIKKFKQTDALSCYRKLMTDREALLKYAPQRLDREQVSYLCEITEKCVAEKKLEQEDLAPLLYLKFRLEGFAQDVQSSYVVIDEAQDFSLFQFFVLKHVLGTSNFTVLGDLSQGIHAYRGVTNWQDVSEQIFDGQANFHALRQSYRTTVEIMELANGVLKRGKTGELVLAQPVVRHGDTPEVKIYSQKKELAAAAVQKVKELRRKGHKSIAVIGKTMPECKRIKKLMEKHGLTGIPLLTGHEDVYTAGVMVLPSYATKGLEFEAVLIVVLEESYTDNELDTKLLYVSMTRAMHSLSVFAMEDGVPFSLKASFKDLTREETEWVN